MEMSMKYRLLVKECNNNHQLLRSNTVSNFNNFNNNNNTNNNNNNNFNNIFNNNSKNNNNKFNNIFNNRINLNTRNRRLYIVDPNNNFF